MILGVWNSVIDCQPVAGSGKLADGSWVGTERVTRATTGDRAPVAGQGIAGLVVSRMTRGITVGTTGEVTGGIAGRITRRITPTVIRPTPDRKPCETTDQGLRAVTVETVLQTMYDTTT